MPLRPDKQPDFWKMSMYFDVILEGELTMAPGHGVIEATFMPADILSNLYG